MNRPDYGVYAVSVAGPSSIQVSHIDGTVAIHDLAAMIARGGMLAALGDSELFQKVFVDHGTVTWPGEIDLGPDMLWDHAHGECGDCGGWWTPDATKVLAVSLPAAETVGDLIDRLRGLPPETRVLTSGYEDGFTTFTMILTEVQELDRHRSRDWSGEFEVVEDVQRLVDRTTHSLEAGVGTDQPPTRIGDPVRAVLLKRDV